MLQKLNCSLYCDYICVWFYQSVGFEEENKYAKGITSAIECANVAAFAFFT